MDPMGMINYLSIFFGVILKFGVMISNDYSELLKLNDFNEMSVPAARTQLLKLTNVASSLCLAS